VEDTLRLASEETKSFSIVKITYFQEENKTCACPPPRRKPRKK
jgi:hypothetical protein